MFEDGKLDLRSDVDYSGISDVMKKVKIRPGMQQKLFSNPVEDFELSGLKDMAVYNQAGQLLQPGVSLDPGVYYVEFEDRVERLVVVK